MKQQQKTREALSYRGFPESSEICWNNYLVPATGLEPVSREAADFRHTTSFDAAREPPTGVRALDYAFALAM